MEAMEKLKSGVRFSEVATQYSEDKARQGVSNIFFLNWWEHSNTAFMTSGNDEGEVQKNTLPMGENVRTVLTL